MSSADQPRPVVGRAVPGFVGFALAVALVWLGGQMVRQGVSDDNLADRPLAAVLWGGDSADALTALARQRLIARDDRRAVLYAKRALAHDPLDAPALGIYGAALDAMGQTELADRVMTLAGTRSWRDLTTDVWLFLRRMRQHRYAESFERVDAMMRRSPNAPTILDRIVGAALVDPAAIDPFVRRLAFAPEWRSSLISELASDPHESPAVVYALLQRLAAGPTPPSDLEISVYLKRLVADGAYGQALQAWRTLTRTPAAAGLVNNGGFERAPGSGPFDWSLTDGVGWSAQIAPAPGAGHGAGLEVDYDGVSPPQPTQQLLVLAPGAYRFGGELLSDGLGSPPPLVWAVVCADSGQSLARAPYLPGEASQWRAFSADFVVPPIGCAAQWLRLTADPGEIHTESTVWYDNLQVVPAPAATVIAPLAAAPSSDAPSPPSP
jgi:hypothetical protein